MILMTSSHSDFVNSEINVKESLIANSLLKLLLVIILGVKGAI